MKKKTYMVLNHEGMHDFDIISEPTFDGNNYAIYASQSGWTSEYKGTKLFELTTKDDMVTFTKGIKSLDVAEFEVLRLFIGFINVIEGHSNPIKFKIIETIPIAEI